MMGTPFVMVYRVSPLTYLLGRSRVKVPHFAMVNLIAGKEIVPELVQQDFTAEKVVARISEILPDGQARDRMIEGLAAVEGSAPRAGHGRASSRGAGGGGGDGVAARPGVEAGLSAARHYDERVRIMRSGRRGPDSSSLRSSE